MEDEPIHIIRQSTRNLLKTNRRIHKDEECDLRRSLKETRITTEDILNIANRLKTKSSITVQDLNILKNGLMDDPKNIEILLNVHGALRGIVRELTGHDIKKQCAAVGCCCNLSLGDSRTCTTVAKAAGSYLTAGLDSLTTEFAVTCAWTLGNLAGSGVPVCNILSSQGALAKLSDVHTNEDLQEAALYALVHFAYQMKDELRPEHLNKILQSLEIQQINMTSSYLLFILSFHKSFPENVTENLVQKILQELPKSIEMHQKCSQIKFCCELVYLIRTLANVNTIFYEIIMNYFVSNNMFEVFKRLLSSNMTVVNDSLLWLLGNIYNNSNSKEFFCVLAS